MVRVLHDGTFKTLIIEDCVLVSDMFDVMIKKCTKAMNDTQRAKGRRLRVCARMCVRLS
jgi:hypothetical protein